MNDKIIVTSMVSGNVGLYLPHLHINKTWPKKGTKLPVDKEALREAIYEPGVEYMFKNGILYIEDMEFKIEIGLEPEGAKVPTEIIPVDEKYLERVLKRMPVSEMKRAVKQMNDNQRRELIDYATEQNDIQIDRITALKDIIGVDLFKVIELKQQKGE